MMYAFLAITVLAAHMFGDFVFQTDFIATNKKNLYILCVHSFIYSYLINSAFLFSYWISRFTLEKPLLDYDSLFLWVTGFVINFLIHCIIDHAKLSGHLNVPRISPFMADQVLHFLVLALNFIVYTQRLSFV